MLAMSSEESLGGYSSFKNQHYPLHPSTGPFLTYAIIARAINVKTNIAIANILDV